MKKKQYQINRLYKTLLPLLAVIAIAGGCKKAQNYYQTLHDQPEIVKNYDKVYGVGDTLTIIGRLNPANNMVISIGGITATVLSKERQDLDRVTVVITAAMGIGENRPITITSAGNTIQCPSIEIIESSNSGYLEDSLQIVRQAALPSGSVLLYCRDAKGSVYYWQSGTGITMIAKDGTTTTVLDANTLKDTNGSFTIESFNAGGVDPQGRYIYFSSTVKDNRQDNTDNTIYRFCRYDLKTNILVTLNRTVYPKINTQRSLTLFMPFEGNNYDVKLMNCTGIYPDSKGNVYIKIENYAVVYMGSDGIVKYIFKFQYQTQPVIWNQATNTAYSAADVDRAIPGLTINAALRSISPDDRIMYGTQTTGAQDFIKYDLNNQVETYRIFGSKWFVSPFYAGTKPYISGSFSVLTGDYDVSTQQPGIFGFMPLAGEKVLILYYQGLDDDTQYQAFPQYKHYQQMYSALGTLNYNEKVGRRYAPGKLLRNGYIMYKDDLMLNGDDQGMIYMTANHKSAIVKTQKR